MTKFAVLRDDAQNLFSFDLEQVRMVAWAANKEGEKVFLLFVRGIADPQITVNPKTHPALVHHVLTHMHDKLDAEFVLHVKNEMDKLETIVEATEEAQH